MKDSGLFNTCLDRGMFYYISKSNNLILASIDNEAKCFILKCYNPACGFQTTSSCDGAVEDAYEDLELIDKKVFKKIWLSSSNLKNEKIVNCPNC